VVLEISNKHKYLISFIGITVGLILVSGLYFGSKGSLLILLLGALILAIRISGIRFMSESIKRMGPWMVTRFGSLVIVHSHHIKKLRENGKEFKIKGKYFCTGCYGMCFGICISIILIIYYLIYGFNQVMIIPLIGLVLLLVIPIILRYLIFILMKSSLRFLSNALLPIGLVLLLCIIDKLFQNWIINGIYELSLIGGGFLRWKIASIDDARLLKRIDS